MILILVSGVFATNIYCRMAYNWCTECGGVNAKRRDQCRNCSAAMILQARKGDGQDYPY